MRLVDRFRYRPGMDQPHPLRTGAVLIAVGVAVAYSALTLELPLLTDSGRTVTMRLDDAANARAGQPVRVGGVDVGKVERVEPGPGGGGARLTLEVDPEVELHADAGASLRWRTMFGGNLYVELHTGSPAAPPLAGEIPTARTDSPVEFDEFLRPLDANGRGAVRKLLAETSRAFAKPGPPRRAIEELPSTAAGAERAIRALRGSRDGDLGRLVAGTEGTMAALGRSEDELAGLIDGAGMTLAVTAARRADLSAALGEAPATLESTEAEMVRLRATLDRLDPLVDALRPGVAAMPEALRAARPTLRELRPVLRDLEPTLADLDPALERLRLASVEGVPLIESLSPAVTRTRERILPWLETDQGSGQRNYQAIGPWLAAAASASGEFDSSGYMWRYQTFGGEGTLNPTACQFTSTGPRENACQDLLGALADLLGAGSLSTGGP